MNSNEVISIDIQDNTRQYYLDEVTCYEKPFVVVLNNYKNRYGSYFILLCKILRVYMYEDNSINTEVEQRLREFIKNLLKISPVECRDELNITQELISELEKGNIIISAGNLFALPYSEIHYKVDNWPHLFIYRGYNYNTKMFKILDNTHMYTSDYKDLRYSDFFLSEATVKEFYDTQGKAYDREFSFVTFHKNEDFESISDRAIVINILNRLCKKKTGVRYRQIDKLLSLNENLQNGKIDNRQLKILSKKILNINKYKVVLLKELAINMQENGYSEKNIDRIKELSEKLYQEWTDYVTVSVSKIKRKRFEGPQEVPESIEEMEKEITDIAGDYNTFLKEFGDSESECEKESGDIIKEKDNSVVFSFTDGKTYNFWIEDNAPKFNVIDKCDDEKIMLSTVLKINPESEESLYQGGIYLKSAQDKVYFMSIDNDSNCVMDTIGENNRKENFGEADKYNIKMELYKDLLTVTFSSDKKEKTIKTRIERLAPVEIGYMVKTWGNGRFLEVEFEKNANSIS